MKTKFIKSLPVVILTVALIATSGFLTGFIKAGEVNNGIISAYADLDEENDNELQETPEVEDIYENEDSSFLCTGCGYIYTGPGFADLPAEWTCPVCGGLKSGFESNDELKYSDPLAWLAHLEHVLAMRSKHLVVLQRVADAHTLKNSPSVFSIYGAMESSSKSILKAQAAVDAYKEYIASLSVEESNNEENLNDPNSTINEEIIENGNNNKDKENDNNKDKENKNSNKGNSSGKNKNK